MTTFKVGESVMYPAHGAAVVKRIDTREVGGISKKFYVLQVLGNQMTIMIPFDVCDQTGVRSLMDDRQIDRVFQLLRKDGVRVETTTWNRRYREYMEKIKTGSAFECAEVLKHLTVLRLDKDLSFGERKMLDYARELLAREISLVRGKSLEVVTDEINRALEA